MLGFGAVQPLQVIYRPVHGRQLQQIWYQLLDSPSYIDPLLAVYVGKLKYHCIRVCVEFYSCLSVISCLVTMRVVYLVVLNKFYQLKGWSLFVLKVKFAVEISAWKG